MKNRTLPYGYQCCNGITVPQPQESEIVKRICESYLNGQSLLTIATWLNEEQIEYMPGVIGWNKARLKRIIEDERYLGKEPYPAILAEETYTAMQQIKEKRNTQKDTDRKTDIFQIAVPVKCPNCGKRLIRRHDSIAQSESENISANVKWGKARSAKEGNVPFHYKNFLGYRKGADGKPEIDPEEAETIRFIYERFLAGDSLSGIAQKLNDLQVPTPSGKGLWQNSTIQSILSNEKYKGDAIINKTYIKDCLSKKVMVNNGERPKYYVENNHPAIIDAVTFGRVQEELARRSGKPKTKQVGTKTEQGKYLSKYAMTELLVCGECKTPYRRCTWTVKGQKKIVWRCINRLDFGKKYCHNSPTVEESILQRAIMRAIMETAQQNLGVLQTLKVHIGMGLQSEQTEDNSMELQIRIAEIDAEFKAMLAKISTDTVDAFDEEKAKQLMDEKARLQQQLDNIRDGQLKREQTQSRLDDIYTILDGLKNRPMEYDEQIVRQLLECITVDSKEQITVIFVGGLKVVQPLID